MTFYEIQRTVNIPVISLWADGTGLGNAYTFALRGYRLLGKVA